MSRYLFKLIADGEHQRQDFKYCISDARKIARTFSAFANGDGGTLLIGVRDNGSIAGISSDEEYYMVESAANLYCKPAVEFSLKVHRTESKTVLEIIIPAGKSKPYLASSDNGRWLAFVRNGDQNLLANRVILNLWKIENLNRDQLLEFSPPETQLFNYLKENNSITISTFRKITGISKYRAEWILARFLATRILKYEISEDSCRYMPIER